MLLILIYNYLHTFEVIGVGEVKRQNDHGEDFAGTAEVYETVKL